MCSSVRPSAAQQSIGLRIAQRISCGRVEEQRNSKVATTKTCSVFFVCDKIRCHLFSTKHKTYSEYRVKSRSSFEKATSEAALTESIWKHSRICVGILYRVLEWILLCVLRRASLRFPSLPLAFTHFFSCIFLVCVCVCVRI